MKLEIIKKVIITIGIILALPFGIFGLLYFQVINSFIAYGINTYYSGLFIGYPVYDQLRDIVPIILNGLLPGLLVYLLIYYLFRGNLWPDSLQILVVLISYSLLYFGINQWMKPAPYIDFKNMVENRFRS